MALSVVAPEQEFLCPLSTQNPLNKIDQNRLIL